jgi:hypothetical protein
MQPLVYYCRWQSAKLRLRGRDDAAVWGELVYDAGRPEERPQRFRYDLAARELTLETADGPQRLLLDEMGVVSSSAGDARQ